MPIFGGRKPKLPELPMNGRAINENLHKMSNKCNENNSEKSDYGNRDRSQTPKLIFQCQLAEGSHTAQVSGFSSIKELYERIGENFSVPASEVRQLSFLLINSTSY